MTIRPRAVRGLEPPSTGIPTHGLFEAVLTAVESELYRTWVGAGLHGGS